MTADIEAVINAYPQDPIDLDNIAQFRGFLERRLLVNRCDDCGSWHQPPNAICPTCWSLRVTATEVSGRGVVHLTMLLHQGPGIEPGTPLPVVTVAFPEQEGLRFTASLVDYEPAQVAIGQPVELAWTDQGGAPWPAFCPTKG
jgi:uncharacterized OB-fold protein